ncbi:MAG: sugar ABC transporter permease [Lachnospiraceae bacterium]|nr:sugar ABC transporter permease [Lachnospiraceae bacterium]
MESKVLLRKKQTNNVKNRRKQVGWLFIAPFAVFFTLVYILPIIYSIYISLFQNKLIGGEVFVGLNNYQELMADEKFWDGVKRVFTYTVIQVPVMLILSMILALALDSLRLYGTKFVRIVSFLPYGVPAIVSTLMWGFMLGTKYGLFKSINKALGTNFNPFAPQWTLVSIAVMATWIYAGYNMLIFYSSLKSVSSDLYEAAQIDGANGMKIVWYIKMPALRGSLVVTIIFSIIGSFQLFNEPQILSKMVSNSGITNYYTPNMYVYNLAFTGSQQGYAAALAIVMAVITIVIAYIVQIRGLRDTMNER